MSVSDRRATFTQIGAAVLGLAVIPSAAVADGAASAATKLRARGIYGSRIAALKSSVASGNIDAIADEKNAFVLFNSGAYTTDRARRQAAIAGTNEIFAAVRSGDKSAVKKAYDAYMKANDISELPSVSKDKGQGAGGDYDYRARTPAG